MEKSFNISPEAVAALAVLAFGEPNKSMSSKTELRFRSKGSLAVSLVRCNGFDFEANQGFGLIELVIWAGLATSRIEAANYLESKNFDFESKKPAQAKNELGGTLYQKKQNDSWKPIWRASSDWKNTIVQSYLEARGILEALPSDFEDIRFHAACPYKNTTTPCMVVLIRSLSNGEPIGIQRTPISKDAKRAGDRLIMGSFSGGGILLCNYHDTLFETALGVGEGFETTLSLRRLDGLGRLPVWCLVNDGNMGKFNPPPNIKHLTIAVDNDEGGIRNADRLEVTAKEKGVKVTRIMHPTPKKDLNDFINQRLEKAA